MSRINSKDGLRFIHTSFITHRSKKNFRLGDNLLHKLRLVENFSYLCAFQRGGRYTHIVFFRLIERKRLKGKSVPATKRFSDRGLKIRKEVGRGGPSIASLY